MKDVQPNTQVDINSHRHSDHSPQCATSNEILHKTTTAEFAHQYSTLRKCLIVFLTSWATLSATFSSTSIFNLTSEISYEFNLSTRFLLISNGIVLLVMGCSSFVWVPIGKIYGRRTSWIAAATVLSLCTLVTALAPNSATFIAFRILSAIQGTYFHVAGQTILADIFEPIHRGTATGFFTAGTVIGPPLGPCIAGIMTTYTSWRDVFWLQFAMIGAGLLLSVLFLPDLDLVKNEPTSSTIEDFVKVMSYFNILQVFRPMKVIAVLLPQISCGLLSWSQYTLLAAPGHLINPRFGLTTPLVSGLFYLAPGAGFLTGTIVGGRFSDFMVVKWIGKRGFRLPQDRLRSGLIQIFTLVPISSMVYGWGLQTRVGGLALPIVSSFFWGLGLLATFASLNTYCAEIAPKQRSEIIAGKYFIQYFCSAIGSAAIIPLIDCIGVGLASTIGVALLLIAGTFITLTIKLANNAHKDKKLAEQILTKNGEV